jgi:hypothetical protein
MASIVDNAESQVMLMDEEGSANESPAPVTQPSVLSQVHSYICDLNTHPGTSQVERIRLKISELSPDIFQEMNSYFPSKKKIQRLKLELLDLLQKSKEFALSIGERKSYLRISMKNDWRITIVSYEI